MSIMSIWPQLLADMARASRACARDAGLAAHAGTRNAKGDAVRAFDVAAHERLLSLMDARLGAAGTAAEVLSEEGAPQKVGRGDVHWRVVMDPVDGSDNAARGLPLSAFACVVLPAGAPLDPRQVQAAIVAPIESETHWLLAEGRMAPAIAPSCVAAVPAALLSVELNHLRPGGRLAGLMERARGVRTYGCCSRALMLVATGALDAHIDIRGRLSPESWLAPAALLLAAGGAFALVDETLAPAAPPTDLSARTRILAAATPALLEALHSGLKED